MTDRLPLDAIDSDEVWAAPRVAGEGPDSRGEEHKEMGCIDKRIGTNVAHVIVLQGCGGISELAGIL